MMLSIANRGFTRCALALLLGSALGCGGLGPAAMRFNRNHYNIAIQRTGAQELLLNLVRLRYRDTPMFLQVASISSNLRMRAEASAQANISSSLGNIFMPGGSVSIEESPTMTYTPLQGEQFVKQLLSPVELEIFLLLTYSGWSMDRAMRLLVQEINGVPNAPTASGPTPDRPPRYEEFRRVSGLLRELQRREAIELAIAPPGGPIGGDLSKDREDLGVGRIYLLIRREAMALPQVRELIELLNLTPGRRYYPIQVRLGPVDPEVIAIVPRSITSALFYASQGVDVSEEDRREGRVTVTRTAAGDDFDWDLVTGDLLNVRTSESRPKGAYVSVSYRGHWFYIDDSDLSSKSSFALLTQVLALQAGDVPSTGPVLTLPVSR